MLPKNPFNSSYSEMINSNNDFLSLFDVSYLSEKAYKNDTEELFITEEMFSKIVFFSSASGGGKSSMLHFFSPSILDAVVQAKDQYNESYRFLEELGVITNGEIKLLGVNISCARNYEVIDDIYENGKRIQVFFALLNVRILKETLKSILVMKRSSTESLDSITFNDIPSELSAVFKADWTGEDYYTWACEEESRICDALNDMDDINPMMFIHNYLSIIQLMEPDNIRFNGSPFVDKVLFMFDDIHRLTYNQRKAIRESLFVVRSRVGVWLAQRTYGLDENEILGIDGSYGREYISRQFENYNKPSSRIEKALRRIAERRVAALKDDSISSFSACIADSIDWEKDTENAGKIQKAYENLRSELSSFLLSDELSFLESCAKNTRESTKKVLYETVINFRAAKIFIDRKAHAHQLLLADFFLAPTQEELTKAVTEKGIRDIAEYYLAIEYGLPFYYGMDKLCSLAFGNVYQFLSFSGAIFERRLSYRYRAKKNRPSIVAPAEQDAIIHAVAKQKWDELQVAFVNSKEIMDFLKNIAYIGEYTRTIGAASYAGGTYTGIGIKEDLYKKTLNNNQRVKSLLAQCVSNNLLRKKHGNQGNKGDAVVVFYLNRWLCAYFNLPLAFGGWKSSNEELLSHIFNDNPEDFSNYYPYSSGGSQE